VEKFGARHVYDEGIRILGYPPTWQIGIADAMKIAEKIAPF